MEEEPSLLVLANGELALVDTDLLPELSRFVWYRVCGQRGYVARNLYRKYGDCRSGGTEYLHVRVNETPAGLKTDHRDLNVLNNTRRNLRDATNQQNIQNQAKRLKPCSSRFKGVCWNREKLRWQANIFIDGRLRHLGRFDDEAEAARAYNEAARENFGEFAHLNEL